MILDKWECLAEDQVWVTDNFLTTDQIASIMQSWNETADYQAVEQQGMKYLVTPTNYHYNSVSNKIANYNSIKDSVLTEINKFYPIVFGMPAPTENLSYMQYFMKTATPNVSFYDLHCEPSTDEEEHFGEAVFMLYLSDEIDGEIVFPNVTDEVPHITPAYEETCGLINVKNVENTVSITPKANRCVVIRTGVPHYVNKCSGLRHCIQGMSFAGADYRDRWKTHK